MVNISLEVVKYGLKLSELILYLDWINGFTNYCFYQPDNPTPNSEVLRNYLRRCWAHGAQLTATTVCGKMNWLRVIVSLTSINCQKRASQSEGRRCLLFMLQNKLICLVEATQFFKRPNTNTVNWTIEVERGPVITSLVGSVAVVYQKQQRNQAKLSGAKLPV